MWPFSRKQKDDDLSQIEKELGLNDDHMGMEKPAEEYDRLGGPSYTERMAAEPSSPSPTQQAPTQNTEIQLVSAKLDTIKAMLEMLNQRLAILEKSLEEKPKQQLVWR